MPDNKPNLSRNYLIATPREAWHIAANYNDLPVIAMRIQSVVQWAASTKPDWQLILELNRHPNDGSSPQWTGWVYRPEAIHPFSSSPASEAAEANPRSLCDGVRGRR